MPDVQALDLTGWVAIIEKIAGDLHQGNITATDLNAEYIEKSGKELHKAIDEGFGSNFNKADEKLLSSLKENAWVFSAAKNLAMQKEMAELIVDENGQIRSFNAFKQDVLKINENYNKTYLQAEYQTALSSSQSARKWNDIQRRKKRFPNLKYRTVGDENVREEHQALDGTIRPVDHPFWDTYYPPNGWRCRCFVTQTDVEPNGEDVPTIDDKTVPEDFRMNVGKNGQSFKVSENTNDKTFMAYGGTTPLLSNNAKKLIATQFAKIKKAMDEKSK